MNNGEEIIWDGVEGFGAGKSEHKSGLVWDLGYYASEMLLDLEAVFVLKANRWM